MAVAGAIAFVAIVATVLVTLTDIGLRTASQLMVPFTGHRATWAIPGVVDLSQLLVLVAAALSIPVAFYNGKHVVIDLIDVMLSKRLRALSALCGAALSVWLVGASLWYGAGEMAMQQEMHTTSATLSIPYVYYWMPLLAGLALSIVAIVARFALFDAVPKTDADEAPYV